jgi:hypothetical protein
MSVADPVRATTPRPAHWTPGQWAELRRLVDPDRLCHAMWMVLDDPERVLGDHHHDEMPAWRTMIAGSWPRGWDRRAESAARIAWSRRQVRRRLERSVAPEFPVHWSGELWERLEMDVSTELCFDALWLLTNPSAALADLRCRTKPIMPVTGPNDASCWLSGTASTALDETYNKIIRFAMSRGEAGLTRAHVPLALGADPTSLGKETINGYLRRLVGTGRLVRVRGAAPGRGGGDLYVAATVTTSDNEPTEPTDELTG